MTVIATTALGVEAETSIERTVVRLTPDGRMNRSDAARYIGLQPKTMAQWALRGYGPTPRRVGNRVFYRKADLDAFIAGDAA